MGATRILGLDAMAAIVADVGLDALMDQMIDRLTEACDELDPELMLTIDRQGFHYTKPDLGLIEWMPAMELGRRVSIKTVGYHPTNPSERGQPSVLATTSLHDTSTGRFLALSEATFLTALRTGAASAVASEVLAVEDATTLGIMGCGAQAVAQVHAMARIRPIERVLAYDAQIEVASSLAARLTSPIDVEVVHAEDLHRLVSSSDIICTATSVEIGGPPVLDDLPTRPWLHINAVGADFPGKIELAKGILDRALVCPDVVAQCLVEGECQQLEPDQLGPDLARLVQGRAMFACRRQTLTVFDSTGWALEDLIAAELLLSHADRLRVGVEIEIQPTPRDPFDPYEFVRP